MRRNWYVHLLLLAILMSAGSMTMPATAQTTEPPPAETDGTGNGYIVNYSSSPVYIGGEFIGGGSGNAVLGVGKDSRAAGFQDVDHVWSWSYWKLCDKWHNDCYDNDNQMWYKFPDGSNIIITDKNLASQPPEIEVGGSCGYWSGCKWETRP